MKRLPRGVVRHHDGYRCWVSIDGQKVHGPKRDTPEEAERDRRRMQARKGDLPKHLATFGDAVALLEADAEQHCSPDTQRYYQQQIATLQRYFRDDAPLLGIKKAHIDVFVAKRRSEHIKKAKKLKKGQKQPKPISGATIRKNVLTLERMFKLAEQAGLVGRDDCPVPSGYKLRIRHEKPATDWFTADELGKTLLTIRKTDPEAGDVIEFLALTGLRLKEAYRLEWEHIDLKTKTLFVRGKRGSREIPLSERALLIAQRLPFPEGRLLPEPTTDKPSHIWAVRKWQRRLSLPKLHPHALRHTFGAALARLHPPAVVAALMGHTSVQMVMRYYHLDGRDARAAVDGLRFHPSESPQPDESDE